MKKGITIEGYTLKKKGLGSNGVEMLRNAHNVQRIRKVAIASLKTEAIMIDRTPFVWSSESEKWKGLWNNINEIRSYHCATGLNPENSIDTAEMWCISRLSDDSNGASIIFWDAYRPNNDSNISNEVFCIFLKDGGKFVAVGRLKNGCKTIEEVIAQDSYDEVVATLKRASKALRIQPGGFVPYRVAKKIFGDNNIFKEVVR